MTAASSSLTPHGRIDSSVTRGSRYELRFTGFSSSRCGYAFPCDAGGHVDIDGLSERARTNYFYARTVIGREFHAPVTCTVNESAGGRATGASTEEGSLGSNDDQFSVGRARRQEHDVAVAKMTGEGYVLRQ